MPLNGRSFCFVALVLEYLLQWPVAQNAFGFFGVASFIGDHVLELNGPAYRRRENLMK
jgi:hypothetical protein